MFSYFFKGNNLNEEINKLDYKMGFIFLALFLFHYKGRDYFLILTNSVSFKWNELNMFGRISTYIIGISFSIIV